MAYAQIRVRSLHMDDLAATERHNARQYTAGECPPNIDTSRSRSNHLIAQDPSRSLRHIVSDRLRDLSVKGVRSNSVVAIEVVVSLSDPDFFGRGNRAIGGYSALGYGANEIQWLEDTYFGRDNVVAAYLHMDESKPHWHIICIPAREREVKYRNRYKEGTRKEMRLCAQDILGGRDKLSAMQTAYYEHCRDRYSQYVPIWRGLRAEEQRREYVAKTDYQIAEYRRLGMTQEAEQLAREAVSQVQQYDATIERQTESRSRPSYQWDRGSEVPEWGRGRGR